MTHDRIPIWLSADLERDLRRWAEDTGAPLPDVVEKALSDFIARNSAGSTSLLGAAGGKGGAVESERRACRRRKVALPAVVRASAQDGDTVPYRLAEIRDISSAGIGLRFESAEPECLHVGREFEVLFQLSARENSVRLACTACRKFRDGAGLVIGAMFSEPFMGFDPEAAASM